MSGFMHKQHTIHNRWHEIKVPLVPMQTILLDFECANEMNWKPSMLPNLNNCVSIKIKLL